MSRGSCSSSRRPIRPMYRVPGRSAVGSASVRPKHRPCSTAFSCASRRDCSVAVKSRSTRAWNVPPAPPVAECLGERALGPVPRLVEQTVKHFEIRLFLADGRGRRGIGLTKRHLYWYTFLGSIFWRARFSVWNTEAYHRAPSPGSPGECESIAARLRPGPRGTRQPRLQGAALRASLRPGACSSYSNWPASGRQRPSRPPLRAFAKPRQMRSLSNARRRRCDLSALLLPRPPRRSGSPALLSSHPPAHPRMKARLEGG